MKYWKIGHSLQGYKYLDDHLDFEIYDTEQSEGLAIIADGVSNCDGGRIAAITVCDAIKDFFKIKRNDTFYKKNPFLLLEESFSFAGRKLLQISSKLKEKSQLFIDQLLENKVKNHDNIRSLKKRIKFNLQNSTKEKRLPVFESTTIVVYFKRNNIYLGMVGDGEILQFSPPSKFYPYLESKGALQTYFSTNQGFQGPIRKFHIVLDKGEVFCFGSDGAKFRFVTKGGSPYSLFVNKLYDTITNKKIIDFPQIWYDTLLQNSALEDDFSMFVLFLENENSEESSHFKTIEEFTDGMRQKSAEFHNKFISALRALDEHKQNSLKEMETYLSLEKSHTIEIEIESKNAIQLLEKKKEVFEKKFREMEYLVKVKIEMLKNLERELESKLGITSNSIMKSFKNIVEDKEKDIQILIKKNQSESLKLLNKSLDKKIMESDEILSKQIKLKLEEEIPILNKISNDLVSKIETRLSKTENKIKNNIESIAKKILNKEIKKINGQIEDIKKRLSKLGNIT